MNAPAIDQKLQGYSEILTDMSVDVLELEVRGIMREIDALSENSRDHALVQFVLRHLGARNLDRNGRPVERQSVGSKS